MQGLGAMGDFLSLVHCESASYLKTKGVMVDLSLTMVDLRAMVVS